MKNPILKNIYTRRSIRKYKDKPVPKELIHEILNAGVMAPSAMNKQPWNFTIVEGRKNIDMFGDMVIKNWNILGLGIKLGLKLTKKESIFYNAPLLIFISGDKKWKYLKDDINLCVQNMFLAAHSLGIGSCWIGFGNVLNKDKRAKKMLGIKKGHTIVSPLIFGYPEKPNTKIPQRKANILKWVK